MRQQGFSLIELVLFVVIVGAALSGILLSFNQSVSNSATPFNRQRGLAVATAYMDEILRKRWSENALRPDGSVGCVLTGSTNCGGNWQASQAYIVHDLVKPTAANGHLYEAQSIGTTAGTEPIWPTDGSTVTDAGVVWLDLGTVADWSMSSADIGPESGEDRSDYDDIDDYDAINGEVPTGQSGATIPGYGSGFSVSVEVNEPSAPWEGLDERDVREVVVTVTVPGGEDFTLRSYRLNF